MNLNIINRSSNPLPAYQTEFSAGLDLCAQLDNPIQILPLQRQLIPTGLSIEVPQGYEAQIRPRSGLALKYGITVLNTPGTIDADYRGEIKVLLINLSDQVFIVNHSDRIAQMIISKFEKIDWTLVENLSDTCRGINGYGSTGI